MATIVHRMGQMFPRVLKSLEVYGQDGDLVQR